MGLFSVFSKRKPNREVTTTVKTYAQEFDKEPEKDKRGLFSVKKKKPEEEINNIGEQKNEEENKNATIF